MQPWLLRLFESEFFNSWIAVSYLFKYPDIGIQDYLCRRLRNFPLSDLEFLLPQLCHLLVSRVSDAMALEYFLLELCKSSTHIAVLTLWYLETYLNDYSNKKTIGSYDRIARLLYKFQTFLLDHSVRKGTSSNAITTFTSRLEESKKIMPEAKYLSSYSPPLLPALPPSLLSDASILDYVKIYPNVKPMLLGMCCVAASIAGSPLLEQARCLALMQGSQYPFAYDLDAASALSNSSNLSSPPTPAKSSPSPASSTISATNGLNRKSLSSTFKEGKSPQFSSQPLPVSKNVASLNPRQASSVRFKSRFPSDPPPLEELHRGRAFSIQRYLANTKLLSKMFIPPASSSSSNGTTTFSAVSSTSRRPNIAFSQSGLSNTAKMSGSATSASTLPGTAFNETYEPYLTGHYYHAEMQFINTLIDISARLCRIPKEARQKALQAELNLLNHNLPASVCLPLWCPLGQRHYVDPNNEAKEIKTMEHHKVVRIPPAEAVVLNSAERVPYLIMVEVLEDELDETLYALALSIKEKDRSRASSPSSSSITLHQPNGKNASSSSSVEEEISKPTVLSSGSQLFRNLSDPLLSFFGNSFDQKCEVKARRHSFHDSDSFSAKSDSSDAVHTQTLSRTKSSLGLVYDGSYFRSKSEPIDNPRSMIISNFNSTCTPPSLSEARNRSNRGAKIQPNGMFFETSGNCPGRDQHDYLYSTRLFCSLASSSRMMTSSLPATPSPGLSSVDAFTNEDCSEKMRTAAILLAQLHDKTCKNPTLMNSPAIKHIKGRIIKEMEGLEMTRLTMVAAQVNRSSSDEEELLKDISSPDISQALSETEDLSSIEKTSGDNNIDQKLASADEHDGQVLSLEGSEHASLGSPSFVSTAILSREDPSALIFKECWKTKESRIRTASPYGFKDNWRLLSVIVKSGADLRQEQLASQLIREMKHIWEMSHCEAWLFYYKVLVTSDQSGLIETVSNSMSVHSVKKEALLSRLSNAAMPPYTLLDHFIRVFGPVDSEGFKAAQQRFLESLAGYCIATYILALKDRHNGNILLDSDGHLIHIDFGFMLSNSPGYVGFETAPFKLTAEYIQLLGGMSSPVYKQFKALLIKSFLTLRKHADRIILLAEMMLKGEASVQHLRERFQLSLTDSQVVDFMERLIASSSNNMFTRLYDTFQYYSNGIL